jgi:hypothetical protein
MIHVKTIWQLDNLLVWYLYRLSFTLQRKKAAMITKTGHYDPGMSFVIVSKKINTRFFLKRRHTHTHTHTHKHTQSQSHISLPMS